RLSAGYRRRQYVFAKLPGLQGKCRRQGALEPGSPDRSATVALLPTAQPEGNSDLAGRAGPACLQSWPAGQSLPGHDGPARKAKFARSLVGGEQAGTDRLQIG